MEAPPPPLLFYGQGRPPPQPGPPAAAPPPGAGHAADYGEVNGTVGDREPFLTSPGAGDLPGPVSVVPNSQPGRELSLALKPTAKGGMFVKAGLKTKTFTLKSGLDRKNERCNESGGREGQPWDKAEMHPVANGIPANGSEYITNGCAGKGADNDGSGSESGYTTPKKRKGRRNSAKGCENLSLGQEKIVPCSSVPAVKLEPEPFRADGGGDPKAGPRLDGLKPAWKCEQPPGALGAGRGKPVGVTDMLRKAADAKVGPAGKKFEERPKGKHALVSSSKEDSWTLFKPPPVFPVDNSSAKIVPKISYASKVKENLNKAVPSLSSSSSSSSSSCSSSAGEVPAQPSTRLPQVPMSAMKSVTSGSFSNGPLLAGADRGGCPAGVQALLVPAASTVLSASPKLACQDAGPSAVAPEQPKSSLFIYPSSMHGLFSVAESPFLATQQNLGDIFQNQWGLSFINEPSAGPETSSARKPTDTKGADVTFQGSFPATSVPRRAETPPVGPEPPAFPKAYELAKRTSPQLLGGLLKLGAAGEESELLLEPHLPGGLPQAEPGGSGAFVFLAKDYRVESCSSSPTNTLLVSTKEQSAPSSLERKASWGEFDLRAAVLYHIQEMESICNLQKRDPKRIITYAEGLDTPST